MGCAATQPCRETSGGGLGKPEISRLGSEMGRFWQSKPMGYLFIIFFGVAFVAFIATRPRNRRGPRCGDHSSGGGEGSTGGFWFWDGGGDSGSGSHHGHHGDGGGGHHGGGFDGGGHHGGGFDGGGGGGHGGH